MKTDTEYTAAACPPEEDLLALHMGEIKPAAAEGLRVHLDRCAACRNRLASCRQTVHKLLEIDEPVDTAIAPAIMRQIGRRAVFARGIRYAAALILLLGSGLFMLARRPGEAPRAQDARGAAIRWLAARQSEDGSWDVTALGGRAEYTVGLEGLALATLARGGKDFAQTQAAILRGGRHLAAGQAADGRLARDDNHVLYNHGMATLGLLEAYATTGDPELAAAARAALDFIAERQHISGGWAYRPGVHRHPNMSISAWQIMALMRAGQLGWEEWRQPLRQGRMWVAGLRTEDGMYGYQATEGYPAVSRTTTLMGLYCSQPASNTEGAANGESVAAGIGDRSPDSYYETFFHAAALSLWRGPSSGDRLSDLRRMLVKRQDRSGPDYGSWPADDHWGPLGGRLYSTALASLSLLDDA